MINYIIRRLLLMIPTLIGITLVVFFTMALAPGDMTQSMMTLEGEMSTDENRDEMEQKIRAKHHLDKSVLTRYFIWLNNLSPLGFPDKGDGTFGTLRFKTPSFGRSIKNRDVLSMINESLPITVLLNVLSIPMTFVLAVWSGIMMGKKRNGFMDVGVGTVYLALYSLPVIWVGVLLIGFFASKQYEWLKFFPSNGLGVTDSDTMAFLPKWGAEDGIIPSDPGYLLFTSWHLILPVICMSYGGLAFLSKMMRTSILENISSDYVRTARAKGLNERIVLYRHVFRNSMIPLINITSGILPALIGGSVIVEKLFSINGMGKLALDGALDRDIYLVMAVTLIGGILGLVSILIADLGYAIADPRVSYE